MVVGDLGNERKEFVEITRKKRPPFSAVKGELSSPGRRRFAEALGDRGCAFGGGKSASKKSVT